MVDADLKSYFDSIPHDQPLARAEERSGDGRILDLIRGCTSQDVMKGLERWKPTASLFRAERGKKRAKPWRKFSPG